MKKVFVWVLSCALLSGLFSPLSFSAEAADISGHWRTAGITEPGGKEETESFYGIPVRFLVNYQLNGDGTFEAVVFGAWARGTWTQDGDSAVLQVEKKAENTSEYMPERLTVKDGQIAYEDEEGGAFRLVRVEGTLDVDKLLDEMEEAIKASSNQ